MDVPLDQDAKTVGLLPVCPRPSLFSRPPVPLSLSSFPACLLPVVFCPSRLSPKPPFQAMANEARLPFLSGLISRLSPGMGKQAQNLPPLISNLSIHDFLYPPSL